MRWTQSSFIVHAAVGPLGQLPAMELRAKLDSPDLSVDFADLRAGDVAARANAFKRTVESGVQTEQTLGLSGLLAAGNWHRKRSIAGCWIARPAGSRRLPSVIVRPLITHAYFAYRAILRMACTTLCASCTKSEAADVSDTGKQWVSHITLMGAFIASVGYMTTTVNGRVEALEARVGSMEERLDSRIDRLEDKIDGLDRKFDQLLVALAGRGVVLQGKIGSKHSEGKN